MTSNSTPAHQHTNGTEPAEQVTSAEVSMPSTPAESAAAAEASTKAEEAGAKLAEYDGTAFRSEGPRTDAKVGALLSLLVGVVGVVGVLGTLGTTVSRQARAYVAAGLLGAAAVVLVLGLLMIVLVILPRLYGPEQRPGALGIVAALPDAAAARAHYRAAGEDPLAYRAADAWFHSKVMTQRYRRIRRAGVVVLLGIVLGLAGGLALGWGL